MSAEGPVYVPTADDEGRMLRVTCRPPPHHKASEQTVRSVMQRYLAFCHVLCHCSSWHLRDASSAVLYSTGSLALRAIRRQASMRRRETVWHRC